MLQTLHISNYALIDSVDIEFKPGFNIITGETGAGKSIMLDALSLLLGARADSRAVRRPEKKSVIEAVFRLDDVDGLRAYCLANDIDWDDDRCILRREIAPSGRSRAFVNDSPVPLTRLQGVAMRLVDIHSQHENQLLTRPEFQLEILDTLAGNASRLHDYNLRYTAFREAMTRLRNARLQIERTRTDEDFMRYQLEQIDAVNPAPGELDDLERDLEVLANASGIKQNLASLLNLLSEGPSCAVDTLGEASASLDSASSLFDPDTLAEIGQRLDDALEEVKDVARTIAAADSRLTDADPSQLEATEQRIDSIRSLLARHRFSTVEQLIALRNDLRRRLDSLDDSDAIIADLERQARRARALAKETAREISEARHHEAERLAEILTERAKPLGMKNLVCDIRVEPADMSATGIDAVSFLFAFNKNQQPMAVGQTASGGEISRLMLTIKAIVADKMQLPSIIFDEVDTGVSGDVANRMGRMMADISRSIQVIAITHLPQIAARGDAHFKVFKTDDDIATHTRITELDDDSRVNEIAVMLSGDTTSDAALRAARALLGSPE